MLYIYKYKKGKTSFIWLRYCLKVVIVDTLVRFRVTKTHVFLSSHSHLSRSGDKKHSSFLCLLTRFHPSRSCDKNTYFLSSLFLVTKHTRLCLSSHSSMSCSCDRKHTSFFSFHSHTFCSCVKNTRICLCLLTRSHLSRSCDRKHTYLFVFSRLPLFPVTENMRLFWCLLTLTCFAPLCVRACVRACMCVCVCVCLCVSCERGSE